MKILSTSFSKSLFLVIFFFLFSPGFSTIEEEDCICKVALSAQTTINSSFAFFTGTEDDEKIRKVIIAA
jgi:hypothetical protein